MMSIIRNSLGTSLSLESTRVFRDDRIKSNPLQPSHKVTDARAEKLVDTSDAWQNKQSGLSLGKMFINN